MKKILFGEITKNEKQDDGTIKVWGWASSGNVDSDGETITAQAMKNAVVDYMKFGAVREMHGNIAAGTAIEIDVKDDGKTWFGAHIVDPIAVKKVLTGVYKGFSIGGRILKRDELNKSIIHAINLLEISLVDRPANPEALFELFKADTIENKNEDSNMEIENKEVEIEKADTVIVEPIVETVEVIEEIKDEVKTIEKSFNNVAWLSRILEDLHYLEECAEDEANWKNEDMTLITELENTIKNLGAVLVAMTNKEVEELTEKENEEQAMRAAEAIEEIQEQELTMETKSVNIDNNDLKKSDDLNKAELNDAIAKAAQLTQENEALSKRVKELEAMPAEPKAILKVIGKGGDSEEIEVKTVEPVYKVGTNKIDDVATLIKQAQTNAKVIKF